ncbi:hypothetical protein [Clostridium sp. YIM B02551]|uniref:hypothetical protein n=1 Tax=Clostridium sp. YIM B02551 TaxID=2910679 RepID=UPI001EEBE499|nr:hypothetical protein [Clostridium sp. YIM B02551]
MVSKISASKGSQYCLQWCMLNAEKELSDLILSSSPSLLSYTNSKVKWISPISNNNFYEYRDDFIRGLSLKDINISETEKKLREFWPKNGPKWDGLGVIEDNEGKQGVLLIEAKAHADETKSDLKASSMESLNMIEEALENVKRYMGVDKSCNWTRNYYQLGNRFAYLYFMNEGLNIPTWLVLVNFVNDTSYIETSLEEWIKHYNQVYSNMGVNKNCRLLDKIVHVFPETSNLSLRKQATVKP